MALKREWIDEFLRRQAKWAQDMEEKYGQHRSADPAPHGRPAQGAGAGDKGTIDPAAPGTDRTVYVSGQIAGGGGKGRYIGPWTMSGFSTGVPTIVPRGIAYGDFFGPQPPIPDAGIKVGEIEAYRCWRVIGSKLHSMAMVSIWNPGEPMTGDVDSGYGVYTWKSAAELRGYIYGEYRPWFQAFWSTELALGRVALWGRVVEHELGYRAEFGKILSLDDLVYATPPDHEAKAALLRQLRIAYRLEERA
jgi:hypothetical protein